MFGSGLETLKPSELEDHADEDTPVADIASTPRSLVSTALKVSTDLGQSRG